LTETDLLEELRLEGQIADPREVQLATIERNGEISVIPRKDSK